MKLNKRIFNNNSNISLTTWQWKCLKYEFYLNLLINMEGKLRKWCKYYSDEVFVNNVKMTEDFSFHNYMTFKEIKIVVKYLQLFH